MHAWLQTGLLCSRACQQGGIVCADAAGATNADGVAERCVLPTIQQRCARQVLSRGA
jgi:hypothetical protein